MTHSDSQYANLANNNPFEQREEQRRAAANQWRDAEEQRRYFLAYVERQIERLTLPPVTFQATKALELPTQSILPHYVDEAFCQQMAQALQSDWRPVFINGVSREDNLKVAYRITQHLAKSKIVRVIDSTTATSPFALADILKTAPEELVLVVNDLEQMTTEFVSSLQAHLETRVENNTKSQVILLSCGGSWGQYRGELMNLYALANSRTIAPDDAAETVSTANGGIPTCNADELAANLKRHIIGQDEVIDSLARALEMRQFSKRRNRPLGSFMFIGPTGVGKTELAKQLAKYYYGSDDDSSVFRLDMSEFKGDRDLVGLIGIGAGYRNSERGGRLTNGVKSRPNSVVILDEIEKAYDGVLDVLLQVFDTGKLSDANGTEVDFRNNIVILTSNLGAREASELSWQADRAERARQFQHAVSETLRPELLARLDIPPLCFDALSRETVQEIVWKEVGETLTHLTNQGFGLVASIDVVDRLTAKSIQAKHGARDVQRIVEGNLLPLVARSKTPTGVFVIENDEIRIASIAENDLGQIFADSPYNDLDSSTAYRVRMLSNGIFVLAPISKNPPIKKPAANAPEKLEFPLW